MRLLFVENNLLFVGMATSLCLETFEVVCAPSLHDGREALEAEAFDVLLVRCDPEDGTVEELIRELRPRFRGAILAILQSGAEADRLLDAGADGACAKSAFSGLPAAIFAALWKRAGALWREGELAAHRGHDLASVQEPAPV